MVLTNCSVLAVQMTDDCATEPTDACFDVLLIVELVESMAASATSTDV